MTSYGVSINDGSFSKDLGSSWDGSSGSITGTFSENGTSCTGSYIYNSANCGSVSSSWTATPTGDSPLDGDTVNIVDPNFLHTLIEQGVDTNGDSLISYNEAEVITDLDANNYWTSVRIVDLTGIEAFTNLTKLDISVNSLTWVDLSMNNNLTVLKCYSNQLTTLDVSSNNDLTELICFGNELSSLDMSNNSVLSVLDCQMNQLTSLDVSNNTSLTELDCGWNQLTSLDVSNNTTLTKLDCGWNQLTSLDVSHNISLTELWCSINDLTSLDVSKNAELRILWYSVNQLNDVDISNNNKIETLACAANQITSLDLSGLTSLRRIYCWSNQFTSLDISNNPALEFLDCRDNLITNLDLSNNYLLEELDCGRNQLSYLGISDNTALVGLSCRNNQLTSLDVTQNTALRGLECGNNPIISLNLSNNNNLEKDIYFYRDLDISSMPTLTKVCVWIMPFPPADFDLVMDGSPNVYFTTECGDMEAPVLYVTEDSLYQPEIIKAISTEEGMIYLVPENTGKNLEDILVACLDSVPVLAGEAADISIADLANGKYLLFARDDSGNLSAPNEFSISGVGINLVEANQIRIYPNPVIHELVINAKDIRRYSIEITLLNGRIIHQVEFDGNTHHIDLSSFHKGVYFITIRSKDFVTTRKIIKY